MTEFDPAKPLKEFKPKKKFFVGIDSDGCAFDTMGIKQRECFCPPAAGGTSGARVQGICGFVFANARGESP
ncbi:MAG: hypothetical protein ACYSP9_08240 [Planctomycetota bacterium]|jgi:hypothetical protein